MKLRYNEETGKWAGIQENSEIVIECGDAATREQLEEFIKSGALTDAFQEWQGEGHQTADEMLAALGFRKSTSKCYSEELGVLVYEKPVQNNTDCFVLRFNGENVVYHNLCMRALWMQPALIEAISAKCKEMGWQW